MDALPVDEIFLFEGFSLDPQSGGLFRADENGVLVPVAIGSRALDLLILLVRRHGDLVSKDEIMTAVWSGMIVEDSNLPTQISALRRVLDQGRMQGGCIQTVSGRGYRFVARVTHPAAEGMSVASPIRPEAIPDLPGSSTPITAPHRRRPLSIATAAAIGLVLFVAAAAPWQWPMTSPSPAPEGVVANSAPQPLSAPRMSIVVLPFSNLSNDPDQYLVDGITDDLTTDLSRLSEMFVISRNTALTYRNKPLATKQIGRDLGVRYVLEGSFRRSGNQVHITAQLIDVGTEAYVWAERFDRDAGDLFAVQNEITRRIAVALKLELIGAEAARPTANPDALDYILRGRNLYFWKPHSREMWTETIGFFERALALDPQSVEQEA